MTSKVLGLLPAERPPKKRGIFFVIAAALPTMAAPSAGSTQSVTSHKATAHSSVAKVDTARTSHQVKKKEAEKR